MSFRSFVFPVLALLAALPASAQDTGGMSLRGPAATVVTAVSSRDKVALIRTWPPRNPWHAKVSAA